MSRSVTLIQMPALVLYHGTTNLIADLIDRYGFRISLAGFGPTGLIGAVFTNSIIVANAHAASAARGKRVRPTIVFARIKPGAWANLIGLPDSQVPPMEDLLVAGVIGAILDSSPRKEDAQEYVLFKPGLATPASMTGAIEP